MRFVARCLVFVLAAILAPGCSPPCQPTTCEVAGATCGSIGDGCGGTLTCGACGNGQTCVANACQGTCEPNACVAGKDCGDVDDGCGHTLSCGDCSGNAICHQGRCCTPKTSCPSGDTCGTIADGCGGTVSCGTCPSDQLCGISDTHQCDTPPDVCSAGAWSRFAQGFFQTNCGACHAFGNDYATVRDQAVTLRSMISSGSMPPGGITLDGQKQLILKWFDCGHPQ